MPIPVAFSKDRVLATGGGDMVVKLWNGDTGEPLFKLPGHTRPVSALTFSRDGNVLASASGSNKTNSPHSVRVWDMETRKQDLRIDIDSWVFALAFSRDGTRLLASCNDGTIRLWDVATGQEALVLRGEAGEFYGAAFSHDGSRIVAGCDDFKIRIWHTAGMP